MMEERHVFCTRIETRGRDGRRLIAEFVAHRCWSLLLGCVTSLMTVATLAEVVPELNFRMHGPNGEANWPAGTDAEQVAFLKSLVVRVRQDDLDGLSDRVRQQLAVAFGVSEARIGPIFDALHRALKKWTTGHPGVTAEEFARS